MNWQRSKLAVRIKILIGLSLILTCRGQAAILLAPGPEGGSQVASQFAKGIPQGDPRFFGGFRVEELTQAEPFPQYYA
jgi:hypothetical protein